MKNLKSFVLSASLLAVALFAGGAAAQMAGVATPGGVASPAAFGAAVAAGDMTEGEVRKIDRVAGNVTLKHGEIRNLDMPAMTMAFQVRPSSALASLKAGDKVRFRAERAGSTVVVSDIRRVK